MKRLIWCLLFVLSCSSTTEPFYTPPDCPDGLKALEWSAMDTLGVVTRGHWCLPAETLDSMFGRTSAPTLDSTGSITIIVCLDGVCPDGTVLGG